MALDGCPLVCVKSTLARHGIAPARHYQLNEYGVKKRTHQDFDPAQAAAVRYYEHMNTTLLRYASLEQAIAALAPIRAALPGAEVALPVRFSTPRPQ